MTILRNIDYVRRMYGHTTPSRAFETAFAAFQVDDANPMRQYLGLPLEMPCEDCGEESIPHGHGKSIVCLPCYAHREAFLMDEVYPRPGDKKHYQLPDGTRTRSASDILRNPGGL